MGAISQSEKFHACTFLPAIRMENQGTESDLFIFESSDSEDELPIKRQKLQDDVEESFQFDIDDTDFSDWEDIATSSADTPAPESFSIRLTQDNDDQELKIRREKLKELIRKKKTRLSLQYLSILSYTLHLKNRNQLIRSKRVLKKLKKLLPKALLVKLKQFWSLIKQQEDLLANLEADQLLVYILKYLIKWHRLNYKINSNGLRVLGYLPEGKKQEDYFTNNASSITSSSDLISALKDFKHNRDTGAVIFTAILRSLGFKTRLVMSLPLLSTSKHTKLQPEMDTEKLERNKDNDLLYPYYWTELINPINESEIFVIDTMCFYEENDRLVRLLRHSRRTLTKESIDDYYTNIYFPKQDQFNQMPPSQYVIGINEDNLVLDISSRYITDISYRYFNKLDLRTESGRTALLVQTLIRYLNHNNTYLSSDNLELDLLRKVALANYSIPLTFTGMKRSPNFVTHSTLLYNEAIDPAVLKIAKVKIDKGKKSEAVYFKNSVIVGKSEQQWKFLGRSIVPTQKELPLKTTKGLQPRTIYRRRLFNYNSLNNMDELNETKLYSFSQTCSYIKEKITYDSNDNPSLPRNKYGNLEIFKENMVPDGCSWIKLNGIEKILNDYKRFPSDYRITDPVNYVPVVVGFDFRAKAGRAIPVKEGVIVLKEQEITAKRVWLQGKIKLHRLDIERREKLALRGWYVFLRRLEIKNRVDKHYL